MMVRCADCGFLTARDPVEESRYIEIGTTARESGEVTVRQQTNMYRPVTLPPLCFVQAFDLYDEMEKTDFDQRSGAVLKVIRCERNCDAFTPWIQGFSPKDIRMMNFEKDRIAREAQMLSRAAWIGFFGGVAGGIVGALATLLAAMMQPRV